MLTSVQKYTIINIEVDKSTRKRGGKVVKVNLDNLRILRAVNQKSQEDLGNVIKKDTRTYARKENGKSPLLLTEGKLIADYYGMTIEEVFFSQNVYKRKQD